MLTKAEDVAFWEALDVVASKGKNRIEELKAMFECGIKYANEIAKLEGSV